MEFFFLWIVMAVVVAMVAKSKGKGAIGWFFYGLLVWPIGLVHALLLRQAEGTTPGFGPEPARPPTVPYIHPSRDKAPLTGAAAGSGKAAGAVADPLDAETLRIAAEWRAAGKQFTMIEAKEEARLYLLERATEAARAGSDAKAPSELDPDAWRRAMFPGAFKNEGPDGLSSSAKETPNQPRT